MSPDARHLAPPRTLWFLRPSLVGGIAAPLVASMFFLASLDARTATAAAAGVDTTLWGISDIMAGYYFFGAFLNGVFIHTARHLVSRWSLRVKYLAAIWLVTAWLAICPFLPSHYWSLRRLVLALLASACVLAGAAWLTHSWRTAGDGPLV